MPRTSFQLLSTVQLANLTRLPIWMSSIFKSRQIYRTPTSYSDLSFISVTIWSCNRTPPKKPSKFRSKFSKSISRQNDMVLKACSLIKRLPTGQVGLSAKRSPGLRLFLFCLYFYFIFGWGWGGFLPKWFLHWRGTRFWKRRECGR